MTAAATIIEQWPQQAREAARRVLGTYGEPHEATEQALVWHRVGPWKRIVASREVWRHNFPAPHTDSVQCVLDYPVPFPMYSALAQFNGSVVVERTTGEVSARCQDEQADLLALNLMHDIVTGARSPDQARDYYTKEFLDAHRGKSTPYRDRLRFDPKPAPDPDEPLISDSELAAAVAEGSGNPAAANAESPRTT
ncbi:hypothetical protein [Nocardia transvalensis]|uniref:hypothetical protein n=1 Tax=Nocardia transvalensis TaxID=37333 RepID=UPI001894D598|nr:hypothetical protein [Nocardia transvalensis]MBF6328016.1 hypothetical protein [Nocardia transvalensis]